MITLFLSALAAHMLTAIVLNIAGLPGALLALPPASCGKVRFILGTVVAMVGQSYVHLAFMSFVLTRALLTCQGSAYIGYLVWPIAFFATLAPLIEGVSHANREAEELGFVNVQVVAIRITLALSVCAFVAFRLVPSLMNWGWSWVPGVN